MRHKTQNGHKTDRKRSSGRAVGAAPRCECALVWNPGEESKGGCTWIRSRISRFLCRISSQLYHSQGHVVDFKVFLGYTTHPSMTLQVLSSNLCCEIQSLDLLALLFLIPPGHFWLSCNVILGFLRNTFVLYFFLVLLLKA